MNTLDILKYGNLTFLNSLQGFSESEWYLEGACGFWSVKEIAAHLTSFENLLEEAFISAMKGEIGPILSKFFDQNIDFNLAQVNLRKDLIIGDVIEEYKTSHEKLITTATKISDDKYRENGTIPWYGKEYCLNDLIVYSNYGHKREHTAQINAFRDILHPAS